MNQTADIFFTVANWAFAESKLHTYEFQGKQMRSSLTEKWILSIVTIVFVMLFGGQVNAESRPKVVGTIGMITDLVANIAGDRLDVRGLMGPGVDPHLYKATRSDIATLSGADIVFYNGLLLEGKITDALIRVATSGKKVHAVTELIDSAYLLEPKEFAGHYDPHVWMDPKAWSLAVEVIKTKLSEFDSKGASAYQAAADDYKKKLLELDSYSERVLSSVPKESRLLVTAHDAFNYFGKRYGYEVLGIQGISTESEAGVQDIERLVDILVARKIKAVFIESTVSQRNIKALIEGAGAKGQKVVVGGELFSDAMGKPGTYEGTYIGMIDHNVTTIARSLGGNAPVGGLNGKLSD